MAITLIREVYDGREHEDSEGGFRELVRTFVVTTDSGEVSPSLVSGAELNGVRIPRQGDDLRDSAGTALGVTCRSVKTRPHKSPKTWWVVCRYSNHANSGRPGGSMPSEGTADIGSGPGPAQGYPPGFGGGASGEGTPNRTAETIRDPLERPATVRYSGVKYMKILEYDNASNVVRNSAGAVFDPPLQVERARLQMAVTRSQALFDPSIIATYVGSINSTGWAGFTAKTVKMTDISAERKFENDIWYWDASYVFEVSEDEDGWNPRKILDAGSYWIVDDVAGTRRGFIDSLGRPIPKGLLDGDGGMLPYDGDPVILEFEVYEERNFHSLKLFGARS